MKNSFITVHRIRPEGAQAIAQGNTPGYCLKTFGLLNTQQQYVFP
jgi:hypothetical protein